MAGPVTWALCAGVVFQRDGARHAGTHLCLRMAVRRACWPVSCGHQTCRAFSGNGRRLFRAARNGVENYQRCLLAVALVGYADDAAVGAVVLHTAAHLAYRLER